MASKWTDDDDSITDINITPFVDVMLVLLVIFMVTANFIVNKGIPITLPKAGETSSVTLNKKLSFFIDSEENYYLDQKKVKLYELSTYLSSLDTKDIVVTISADKKSSYDSVIKLIDYLRTFNISDFSFVVDNSTK